MTINLFDQLKQYIRIAIAKLRNHTLFVIANQEIINAINEQIGNELGAMLQFSARAVHLPRYSRRSSPWNNPHPLDTILDVLDFYNLVP